ncbi:MAG TPA: UbiA-like polyprenyltransferase, partial [Acidobacteriota bacterium]|nr:UbiA-like polyprenyltransferase [Acidobacteriota bacterium]
SRWPLAAGTVSVRFVVLFVVCCSALFVFSAFQLNRLAFLLSPVALFLIFFYSFTKRFTLLSHWFIGLALAIGPAGAWIAVRGDLNILPLILSLSILFWVAGFDLIYSCQDAAFDRDQKLHSVPARLGVSAALTLSAVCHVAMVGFLVAFGYWARLGFWYYLGSAFVAALLLYEHSLVSPQNLTRVNEAFFTINGMVSVLLLIATSIDLYL